MEAIMIEFNSVSKIYAMGDEEIKALNNISFTIPDSKFTVILGPSGSGKSTMLNLLGGMDKATSGSIMADGEDVTKMDRSRLEEYRRKKIGFVFQFYNLIPQLTAKENIGIAAKMIDNPLDVDEVIKAVGLEGRKNLFPANLSGGELQRIAIARALVKRPNVLLCDEPTGALDSETGKKILELLKKTAKDNNISLIIVTHNANLEKAADLVIRLKDGKVQSCITNDCPADVEEVAW